MFPRRTAVAAALFLSACVANAADPVPPIAVAPKTRSTDILPLLEKCADAQLAIMKGKASADWTAATFYVGLARLSHTSTNPKYGKAAFDIAEKNNWEIHSNTKPKDTPRRFKADDQAIGQLYIDLAVSSHDLKLLDPLIKEETALLGQFEHFNPALPDPAVATRPALTKMEVIPWWWADSLFMNPPVLTRLSQVTADPKFIDAMDREWWKTTALLYDKEEHLFYRDNRFLTEKTKNGKKVFWSRGDGWVMGGLAEVLTYMPDNYPARKKYETLFKDIAARLLTLQGDDGLWPPSLLDPEDPSFTDTSGSAFFTYAFAWGINHHLLDSDKFEPATQKAWAALVSKLRPDGQLGFVQPVGFKPDAAKPITIDSTQYYGNGAFLLAGCEMLKLARPAPPAPTATAP